MVLNQRLKGRTAFRGDTEASFKRALALFQEIYQSKSSKVTTSQRATCTTQVITARNTT